MRWLRRRPSRHSSSPSSGYWRCSFCLPLSPQSDSVPNRPVRLGRQDRHPSLMESKIRGLHHVTAIASDSQRNLDFYVGLLGLRFVKRTVNFDDPASYHFYFGDARGTPGTILTFFSWPGARRGIRGAGQIEAIAFAVPPNSVGYWLDRFKENHVPAEKTSARFGEEVIRFADPDGLLIELIASISTTDLEPWSDSTVPIEHSLRGFHS